MQVSGSLPPGKGKAVAGSPGGKEIGSPLTPGTLPLHPLRTAVAQEGGTVGISSSNPATQYGGGHKAWVAVPGPGCDLWADTSSFHFLGSKSGLWTHLCCEHCSGNLSKWQAPLHLSTFMYKMTDVNQLILRAPPASKNWAEA